MDTNRYYFPEVIGDDSLSILAVEAKDILEKHDNIAKIFQMNNQSLCGHSPRQLLFLMKQNNTSFCSRSQSPRNKSNPSDAKPEQGSSTPVTRNPDISNLSRRHLQLVDTEMQVSQSGSIALGTPIRRQKVKVSSKDEKILNPSIEKTAIITDQFSSQVAVGERSEKINLNIPAIRPTLIVSSKDEASLVPIIEKSMSEEQLSIPNSGLGKPEADSEKSPCSAEMAKMTENLTIIEKDFESPVKVTNNMDVSYYKTPSTEVTVMAVSLTMNEEKLESPAKVTRNVNPDNLESPRSAEITRMTSGLTVDDIELRSIICESQLAGNLDIHTDSSNPEEITVKSDNLGSTNKDSMKLDDEIAKISKSVMGESETPSPVKRSRMCNIPASDIHGFDSSAQNIRNTDRSPENRKTPLSFSERDEMKVPENEASKGFAREEIKRKSLPLKKRNEKVFESILRVIKSDEKPDIDIEVSGDLDNSSPTTSRSSLTEYTSHTIKEVKSPAGSKSKNDTSPSLLKWFLTPPSRTSASSSCNASASNSPGSDDVFVGSLSSDSSRSLIKDAKIPIVAISESQSPPRFLEQFLIPSGRPHSANSFRNISATDSPGNDVFDAKLSSDTSSIVTTTTGDRSCKSESSLANIETDPVLLKHTIVRFNVLLALRGDHTARNFCALLSFQNGIQFLSSYVLIVEHTLLSIGLLEREWYPMELEEIIKNASDVAKKLTKKLKAWKRDVDLDVTTFLKATEQIDLLKAKYEPLLSNEDEPVVTIENVEVYEHEMKAIWKKLDDMMIMTDSRRALFSHIAYDVEQLMKMFVKCLILVEILQLR